MIFYCEDCKQYWKDGYNPTSSMNTVEWRYCTIDGIPISLCPMCVKEVSEIIKDLPNSAKTKDSEVCPLCTEKYGVGNMNCANLVEHKPDEYCRLEHVHDTPKKHIWSYGEPGKRCDNCGYTIKSEVEAIDN